KNVLLASIQKDPDKSLTDAVQLIRTRLTANLPPPPLPAVVLNAVKDYAEFFTPAAVQRADREIQAIKQSTGKDVVVETFKNLPPDKSDLENLLAERSAAAKGNGVHILIVKEPSKIQVGASEELLKKHFPAADVTRLRDTLLANFREKTYDKGLTEAIDQVRTRLGSILQEPVLNAVRDYGK